MVKVKEFFARRHWEKLVPDADHTFVTAGLGGEADHTPAARASDGSWGAVFVPFNRKITVNMSVFATPVRGQWFDPVSGALTPVEGSPLPNRGLIEKAPPGDNSGHASDWVLVFE
jgi:hypothetical protein